MLDERQVSRPRGTTASHPSPAETTGAGQWDAVPRGLSSLWQLRLSTHVHPASSLQWT